MNVFCFQNAFFQKTYQAPAFDNFSWEYKEGQQWGIIGPSGSGKTTLAEAAAGKLPIRLGKASRLFDLSDIHYLSFEEDSSAFHYQDYYYQQRFQASESDSAITVREFLGPTDSNLAIFKSFLDLAPLLPLSLLKLSNGQTRKMRIVKALLSKPKCLLLDKPFTGLDVSSRKELHKILQHLTGQGIYLFLIDEYAHLPSWISHLLVVDNCKIGWEGPFANYSPHELASANKATNSVQKLPFTSIQFHTFLRLSNLCIQYGNRQILSGLTWEVKQGERWLIKGPNGAGKSTLLSILYADVPQSYSQDIVLFDKKRGSGESIWDIKQRIGYYSPELQYYFKHDLTVLEVIETGLTDRLYRQRAASEEETACIVSHLEFMELRDKGHATFQTLGKSTQNVVLLLRALIKNPPLLLLDEPFLSLSTKERELCKSLLEHYLAKTKSTLLLISHHEEEIEGITQKTLELEEGKLKFATE